MPYVEADDGHRLALEPDVMGHCRAVFDQGLKLEAILLAHEYLELALNQLYYQRNPRDTRTVHRKFKNLIDLLFSDRVLKSEDYEVLNEFNRLRNSNANLVLNSRLTLKGAKKGDLVKNMDLASRSAELLDRLMNSGRKTKRD